MLNPLKLDKDDNNEDSVFIGFRVILTPMSIVMNELSLMVRKNLAKTNPRLKIKSTE